MTCQDAAGYAAGLCPGRPSKVNEPANHACPRRRKRGSDRHDRGRLAGHNHANADPTRPSCRGPKRYYVVDRGVGRIDRRHDPEFVRVRIVNLERVTRIVAVALNDDTMIAPSTPTLVIAAAVSSPLADSSPCEGPAQGRPGHGLPATRVTAARHVSMPVRQRPEWPLTRHPRASSPRISHRS